MKTLILHPYFFRDYKGGVERYCHNLMAGFSSVEQVETSYITGNHFQVLGQSLPTRGIIKTIKNSRRILLPFFHQTFGQVLLGAGLEVNTGLLGSLVLTYFLKTKKHVKARNN